MNFSGFFGGGGDGVFDVGRMFRWEVIVNCGVWFFE